MATPVETFDHRGVVVVITANGINYDAHAGGRSLIVRRPSMTGAFADACARIDRAIEHNTTDHALWLNDTTHWRAEQAGRDMPTEIVRRLAQRTIEHVEALGLKGKRADDAALHYFVGAASLADETGNRELAQHLGTVCVLIVSVRGMFGIRELAQGA